MFRRERFVPVWFTLGYGCVLFPWAWSVAHATSRTTGDWALVALAATGFVAFHAYWFGVRTRRQKAMWAALHERGFRTVAPEDPSVLLAVNQLCPTSFTPKVRRAARKIDGPASCYILDAWTSYHRTFPRRENLVENWTYLLEARPLPYHDDIYVMSRSDRLRETMRDLTALSAGLTEEFNANFLALSKGEVGPAVPPKLQEVLLRSAEPALLGTFCLKLGPRGWGFSTSPVKTQAWMERFLRFAGELGNAI